MKQAVVTGGTRGIGRAVADRLAAEGWSVLVLARTPIATPHRFAACDVADAAAVQAAFAPLARIDALVNCAGIAGANRLDGDDALWHAIIGSNLHGTYHCCKAALPKLPDGTGRIVNLASVLGLRGVPDQTAYCAAKHGVIGLTRALALAVAGRGITVNALCPGWVDTGMAHDRYAELGITPAQAAASVPTGQVATSAEIADAVIWLLRPESRGVTGHALPIDGGGLALP
ncbi:MAG TPA: SDR family oxidoreductase [Rhodopila sp.]|uniref:SDR family NAD(P)-dependent oxidoreductase n=1 Tax=Rhodopila sp. TaxID=2480087 RepID=UPI002BCE4B4F|nr:SDR family oxidoreductase [Rhodopila sp.]HVY13775.1 SDR family oxidoreductase [Rhodopila sp.]